MNKSQLRDRTRQLSGAELEDLRSTDEIDTLVDEAYRQIGNLEPWVWRQTTATFDTASAQAEYDVPANIVRIQGVTATGLASQKLPLPLREATLRDLLTRVRRDDEDLPRFYARVDDRRLRLGPVPDGVYTIEVMGLKPLAGIPEDSSEPEWDPAFHAAVAYLAASVLLDEESQPELAAVRRQRADQILLDMIEFYQVPADTTPFVLGGGQDVRPADTLGSLWPWRR